MKENFKVHQNALVYTYGDTFWKVCYGQFHHCVNLLECAYPNLDGIGQPCDLSLDAIKRQDKHERHEEAAASITQHTVLL